MNTKQAPLPPNGTRCIYDVERPQAGAAVMSGARTMFVLECSQTAETQSVIVCQKHAQQMPPVSELVRAYSADDDCACEFCDEHPIAEVLL